MPRRTLTPFRLGRMDGQRMIPERSAEVLNAHVECVHYVVDGVLDPEGDYHLYLMGYSVGCHERAFALTDPDPNGPTDGGPDDDDPDNSWIATAHAEGRIPSGPVLHPDVQPLNVEPKEETS